MNTKTKWSLAPLLALAILFAFSTLASAQAAPYRVATGSDGTLYLIANSGRYEMTPPAMTDADMALPDLGVYDLTVYNLGARPPTVVDQPVTFTETGALNTKPFDLVGGNYSASFVATVPSGSKSQCILSAYLKPVATDSGFFSKEVASGTPTPDKAAGGETQIYNVPAGQYYVDATVSTCGPWTLTINTQQP
jgi:hypothetical protein